MRTVNIHEAKTHLSPLVEEAAGGEPFIITKAGRSLVKVVALDVATGAEVRRLGFMTGDLAAPDDVDQMWSTEIAQCFDGEP